MGAVHVIELWWNRKKWVDNGYFDLGLFKIRAPLSMLQSVWDRRKVEANARYGTPVEQPVGLYTVDITDNKIDVSVPSTLDLSGKNPVEQSNLFLESITPELKEIFKKKSGADIHIKMPNPYDLNEEAVKNLPAYKKLEQLCVTQGIPISIISSSGGFEPEFQNIQRCRVDLKVPCG